MTCSLSLLDFVVHVPLSEKTRHVIGEPPVAPDENPGPC